MVSGRIIYGGAYGFPRGVDIILTDQTLLTPEEASRYLRLSVESVYNFASARVSWRGKKQPRDGLLNGLIWSLCLKPGERGRSYRIERKNF